MINQPQEIKIVRRADCCEDDAKEKVFHFTSPDAFSLNQIDLDKK